MEMSVHFRKKRESLKINKYDQKLQQELIPTDPSLVIFSRQYGKFFLVRYQETLLCGSIQHEINYRINKFFLEFVDVLIVYLALVARNSGLVREARSSVINI